MLRALLARHDQPRAFQSGFTPLMEAAYVTAATAWEAIAARDRTSDVRGITAAELQAARPPHGLPRPNQLRVRLIKAKELPAMDTQMFSSKTTSSDPFATVSYRGVEHKTEVQKKELNPVWDFECEWPDLELDAKYDTRLWPDGRPMDGPDGKPLPNMLTKMFSRQQADFQKKRDEARREKAARRTPRFSEEDWGAVIVQVWDWDRTSGGHHRRGARADAPDPAHELRRPLAGRGARLAYGAWKTWFG